jgi:parvulin-like peptidyl-prolyl isomerase
MEEKKDNLFEETVEDSSEVNEAISQKASTAEDTAKNKWILWVMGIVLAGLIAFLIIYITGKPAGTKTANDTTTNTTTNTSIEQGEGELLATVGEIEIKSGAVREQAIKILAQSQQIQPEQLDTSDPQVAQSIKQAQTYLLSQFVQNAIFAESLRLEGIEVTEQDLLTTASATIDDQIKPYVSQKPMDEWGAEEQTNWGNWLTQQGFGSEEDLRQDFILRYPEELKIDTYKRLLYGDELAKITITELEAKNWFEAPGRIKLSHILFSYNAETDPPEKEAEARNLADKTRLTVLSGSNFSQLASELSQDPSATQNGGDLGWYMIQDGKLTNEQGASFVPEFEKAALRLNKGDISALVKTQFGFHIITVTEAENNGSRYSVPEGIRITSIQVLGQSPMSGEEGTSAQLSPEELEAKANEALSKVLSGELTFAEAVAKYSDDQMTASNGGEIPSMMATDQSGFFWADLILAAQYDGQGMYPFEKNVVEKLWTLKAGEIFPEPIRTASGWFIGKVIAHRQAETAIFENMVKQATADRLAAKKVEFERAWMEDAREKINIEYTDASGMNTPQNIPQP